MTFVEQGVLTTLAEDLGDHSIITTLIETFIKELTKRSGELAVGIEQRDHTQVRRAAHSLRSSSATLGAFKLQQVCEQIELGDWDHAMLRELEDTFGRVAAATVEALRHRL